MKKLAETIKKLLGSIGGFFKGLKPGGFFKKIGGFFKIIGGFFKKIGGFFKKAGAFLASKLKFLPKPSPKPKKEGEEEVEYFSSETGVKIERHTVKKSKKTLGVVIMAAGCSVVLVLSVIMCVINCILSYSLAQQYITEEIESSLSSYQLALLEKTDIIHLEAEATAGREDIYTGNLQMNTRKSLLEKQAEGTSFTDFSIAKDDGTTYNDTDISDRDYFKEAKNGTTYISSPVIRKTDGSIVFMCGAKISSLSFSGVAYGAIDYTLFTEMLSTMKIGEESSAFILDKNGTIISHPNTAYVRDMKTFAALAEEDKGMFSEVSKISEKMIAGETAVEEIKYLGKDCYVGYTPVDNAEGWSLAVVIPKSQAFAALQSSVVSNILVLVVLLVMGAGIFLIISGRISKPINLISERLGLLADGDLYSPVPDVKSDISETKMLMQSLSRVTTNLSSITDDIDHVLGGLAEKNLLIRPETDYLGDFRSIRTSLITISNTLISIVTSLERVSNDVSNGSSQILSSSENLANSTIQQSSSLDALSGNITQISERIEANVGITTKASNLVADTVQRANASTEKMSHMISSMDEISKTSEQIDIIIQTIDDIAFQTNILALNAAVEAAKAGEAGKGFAVVADEVRNLASRSAEAANNTAKLITESIAAVHKGEEIADDTAVALSEIVRNIDQINEFMIQIASASDEQAQRISGINESMTVINDLTQNTSATSEECAAASHEFSSHSAILKSIVEEFKTTR